MHNTLHTLLAHEIVSLLKSKRIYLTVLMFLLLFASVFIVRVIDYSKQLNQYIADEAMAEESLQNAKNYSYIRPRAIQRPIIFSIYNEGYKIPRVIDIQYYEPILASKSINEETNLLYEEDTQLDITFLITFFLSLFILLISYDSVNGEKQVGTLRLLLTFPIKRQSFILKKILGVFIFVAFTFTFPYILSLITLTIIYANLLTINFFLSAFFYWFLTLLFIFFFSLLGIFISCCTTKPNRALVYALLVWTLFSIILPISWEYIIEPKLYDDTLATLTRNYEDKFYQSKRIFYLQDLEEDEFISLSTENVSHMIWNGAFYDSDVWGDQYTHEQHIRYQNYIYENYYPASRGVEQARDEVLRKRINIENNRALAFFYNPIMLFENLASKITGNSRDDQLIFLHTARQLRDELVSMGAEEGWLLDYRFQAIFKEEYIAPSFQDIYAILNYETNENFLSDLYKYLDDLAASAEPFEMSMPIFRRYQQPILTFGEVFERILSCLIILVVSILALWLITWQRFMKYDVR